MADDARETIVARTCDVFVSYKREDDDARAVLVAAHESAGYKVFWDTKLGVDEWKGELRDEINRCGVVICLCSSKAARSDNVKAEAFGAYQLKKLMSAPIEKIAVPDYFKGTNLHPFDQWADQAKRLPQLEKILANVKRLTGGPSRKPVAAGTTTIPVEFGDIPGAPARLIGRDGQPRRAFARG